jgi:hypothetical protein
MARITGDNDQERIAAFEVWRERNFGIIMPFENIPYFQERRHLEELPIKHFGTLFIGARKIFKDNTKNVAIDMASHWKILTGFSVDEVPNSKQQKIRIEMGIPQ